MYARTYDSVPETPMRIWRTGWLVGKVGDSEQQLLLLIVAESMLTILVPI
jgi:hypothetical protein